MILLWQLQPIRKVLPLRGTILALLVVCGMSFWISSVSHALSGIDPVGVDTPTQAITTATNDYSRLKSGLRTGYNHSKSNNNSDFDGPQAISFNPPSLFDLKPAPAYLVLSFPAPFENRVRFYLPSPRDPPTT